MALKGIYEVVFKLGEQAVVDYTRDVLVGPISGQNSRKG